jgi:hypothetical protein
MKRTLNIVIGVLVALLVFSAVSCGKLDVVGNDSVRAFGELLKTQPVSEVNKGWALSAPDNSARFVWNCILADNPLYDVMLEFDAAPFIAAGLDPSKLPGNFTFRDGALMTGIKWQPGQKCDGDDAPLPLYRKIVKFQRNAVGYHGQMDHYGINLGDGNLFEWAKNLNTNDKDIVFVLEPAPLIRAGVDPNRIAGWAFAKVTVDDENGKPVEVDKILKPFNLL